MFLDVKDDIASEARGFSMNKNEAKRRMQNVFLLLIKKNRYPIRSIARDIDSCELDPSEASIVRYEPTSLREIPVFPCNLSQIASTKG
jgi:hypothetical protein